MTTKFHHTHTAAAVVTKNRNKVREAQQLIQNRIGSTIYHKVEKLEE